MGGLLGGQRVCLILQHYNTVLLQWLEHLWDQENMFETGVVRASECSSQRQNKRQNRYIFSIFLRMNVYCVFSMESSHRGDSNEYTKFTIFNKKKKKKIILNHSESAAMGFFQETQERVRNSRGKRAISVLKSH